MHDTCQNRRFAILKASVQTELSFEVKNCNSLMYTLFNTDALDFVNKKCDFTPKNLWNTYRATIETVVKM